MTPRGGKRPGAGRKAGAPNKATAKRQKEVKASGLTPLDYLLRVMRNEQGAAEDRMEAAKAAAPYVHPRLAAIEHKGDPDNPVAVEMIRRVIIDPDHTDA